MDKQIKKVKKQIEKAEHGTERLLKIDKKHDAKLEKCDSKMMKKKGKK